ncbi:NAD(P)/FAD-dependent oxidoreductase [Nitrosomonas communis]|uniref:NAD(P)/FAD-dependent oxidoreductase n=1 Tax=Nitrosomonas communis TaxID=44574 RepID=UPI003D273B31
MADSARTISRDAEVIVVGAGPAGSTMAAALAELGHDVLLLDKASFPRHKPCSDYVNPAGAQILAEMGLGDDLKCAGAHTMEGMLVHAPNGSRFLANYAQAEPGRAALGLSRYRLDNVLLECAKAAGVTVCERAHVREALRSGDSVTGVTATIDGTLEEIRAKLVIGADGRNSAIVRSLGLSAATHWPRKTGLAAHYRGVNGLERYGEMHVGRDFYAGLAILECGLTNVTIVVGDNLLQRRSGSIEEFFAESLRALPAIASKLDSVERVGGIRGVGSMAHRARQTVGNGYLLVGDAAAFLDPFAGEGIYEALRAARLAAPIASAALKSADASARALAPYRAARRRAFTAKRSVSWIVQGFINSPSLMNYVTERLAAREELGLTLSGVLGDFRPAGQALSPIFLARLLRP